MGVFRGSEKEWILNSQPHRFRVLEFRVSGLGLEAQGVGLGVHSFPGIFHACKARILAFVQMEACKDALRST